MTLITRYKTRQADHPIDELILTRYSPRAFDTEFMITDTVLFQILEAARWAPSSNNMQPWKFIYTKRGSEAFTEICKHLTGFNNVWVPRSSLLILAIAEISKDGKDIRDLGILGLGQACQNLVLECLNHGLHAHQFGGFYREEVTKFINLDTTKYYLSNIIAVGKLTTDTSWMPEEKLQEENPNTRKPITEFTSELL